MPKTKILLLIPNLDFGGAQRVFFDHAKLLGETYEVRTYVFNLEDNSVLDPDVQLSSLNVPAGRNVIDKAFRFLQRCIKLYRIKKKESPTVTISHLEGADYVNLLSFGRGKKILVIHGSKLHDKEIDNSYGFLRKRILIPFLYPLADHIFTVSKDLKTELTKNFKLSENKVTTIYNSFSISQLVELYDQKYELDFFNENSLNLITSGRIAPQKNQIALLHILKILKERLKAQLYIIGEGPLKNDLFAECLKLGLKYTDLNTNLIVKDSDVIFMGYHKNPLKFYKDMDLFLLSSKWEGFPLALGEAMAVGIPVLASDCPTGPKELLLAGNYEEMENVSYPLFTNTGVLLPIPIVTDENSLSKWVEAIIDIKNRRMMGELGINAKKRMEDFDRSIIKKQLLSKVAQVINA